MEQETPILCTCRNQADVINAASAHACRAFRLPLRRQQRINLHNDVKNYHKTEVVSGL